MENQPNGLDELLKSESPEAKETLNDQEQEVLWVQVMQALGAIEDSLGNMHVGIRSLNSRVSTLENFVSYLISKDPKAGPAFAALAEKAAKAAAEVVEESAQDETKVLSALPPQAE